MGTTIQTLCLAVMLALCLAWPAAAPADPLLPHEPGEELLVEQSYDTILGLLFRGDSLKNNGRVDDRTARHILWISYDNPASEEPDVAPFPLLYGYDADQNGQWEMWGDREETGQLTEAVRYDWRQGEDLLTTSRTW